MEGLTDFTTLDELERLLRGESPPSAPSAPPSSSLQSPKSPKSLRDCLRTYRQAHLMPDEARTYIVNPIVPTGKTTLLLGDSGIGKTPLLYQLCMSVAAGKTFLNMPVQQGPVLYVDAESSLEHSRMYQRVLGRFLGISGHTDLPFTVILPGDEWPDPAVAFLDRVEPLVKILKPVLVVFDCLRVLWPEAEKDNATVQKMWKLHSTIQNTYKSATLVVHHLRKQQVDPKTGRAVGVKLQSEPREWLQSSAGSGAILNTCESRVGVALYKGRADRNKTIVIGGFAKSEGDYDPLVAERVVNEHGKPQGYAVNITSLRDQLSEDARGFLDALPNEFRNRDAVRLGEQLGDMSESKVNRSLAMFAQAQLIMKLESGAYQKLGTV